MKISSFVFTIFLASIFLASSISAQPGLNSLYLSSMYQVWKSGAWVDSSKTIPYRGANSVIDSQVTMLKNLDSWINDTKMEYRYNTNATMDSMSYFLWDAPTSAWTFFDGMKYTFSGQLPISMISKISVGLGASAFSMTSRMVFSYDSQDRLIADTVFSASSFNPVETPSSKNLYVYDNKRTVTISWSWNSVTNAWGDSTGIDSTFLDAAGNDSVSLTYMKSTTGWGLLKRTTSTYSGKNITTMLVEKYSSGSFVNNNRTVYSYSGSAVVGKVRPQQKTIATESIKMRVVMDKQYKTTSQLRMYSPTGRVVASSRASQAIIIKYRP